MMATNGWQIPQFKLKDITISCTGDVLNTHGTTLILQSSPFLETFTMYGYMYNKVRFFWFSFSNLRYKYVCLII